MAVDASVDDVELAYQGRLAQLAGYERQARTVAERDQVTRASQALFAAMVEVRNAREGPLYETTGQLGTAGRGFDVGSAIVGAVIVATAMGLLVYVASHVVHF